MEKKNYKNMLLESASGFIMPFALDVKEELHTILGFGKQIHPSTGQNFFHQGIDFAVKGKPLYGIASGSVVGVGKDSIHDQYIVCRYGKYEVTYGHISETYKQYGEEVLAGDVIATSGNFLHLGVRFEQEQLDPEEFLAMVWANIQQLAAMGIKNQPHFENLGGKNIKTHYDDDKDQILMLMLRFLPTYFNDLCKDKYTPPARTETSLRNILAQAAEKNYFYEKIPDLSNPLGLTSRSAPLAEKIQNILISDFLEYLAAKYNIYPSSWSETQKKKFLTRQQQTV